MASSKLKLTYFDFKGLGEVARIVLAFGEKEYIDDRMTIEEWRKVKTSLPLEQMPILEIDGDVVCQSYSIWAFLAKEFGLYPESNRDQLTVDMIGGICYDMVKLQGGYFYLKDGPEKEAKAIQAKKDMVKYLKFLEGLLAKNGTGYFVGDSVTLADIIMFDIITGYCKNTIDYSQDMYPMIAKNVENVLKVDKIAAYVAKRPETIM